MSAAASGFNAVSLITFVESRDGAGEQRGGVFGLFFESVGSFNLPPKLDDLLTSRRCVIGASWLKRRSWCTPLPA